MKVTPNNPDLNAKKIDKQTPGKEMDSAVSDVTGEGLTERDNFASVLDRVTKSHDRSRDSESSSSNSSRSTEKTDKDKSVDDDDTGVFAERPITAERATPGSGEDTVDATSILHTVDLDKIVAACRVQVSASGQPEVFVELSRSVLECLRVKVSTDGAGRITAEFIAANEGVKSLLDSRSSELLALLRSRNINLAEFRSSVDTGTHQRGDSSRQENREVERVATDRSTAANQSQSIDEVADAASGSTYRA
jgi:hypothetical protein